MKIILFGYGKMGRLIAKLAEKQNHVITVLDKSGFDISAIETCDVCIDFSHAEAVLTHVKWAASFKKPIVIGTTGWEKDLDHVKKTIEETHTGAVYSPNFSLGVALFISLLEFAAPLFSSFSHYDAVGIESHHSQKKDAPSGTAKTIQELFNGKLSFTSVRCGQMPGTHTVIFDSAEDTISLTHEARNREGFAKGALQAAEWICDKKGWWTFHDLVRSLYTAHYSL